MNRSIIKAQRCCRHFQNISTYSSFPISSCILLSNCKLTLFYAEVLNSWTNSLQLGGYDENKKDVINRRNGQMPKHLKLFLLVFSKDEARAQEVQAQPMRSKAKH